MKNNDRHVLIYILILTLAILSDTWSNEASFCNVPVSFEAENEYMQDGYRYYQGNPSISLGGLTLKGDEISVSVANDLLYLINIVNASFRIEYPDNVIEGSSQKAVLNLNECTMDLFGNVIVKNKYGKENFTNIRYFMSTNKIKPILLYIDQSPRRGKFKFEDPVK